MLMGDLNWIDLYYNWNSALKNPHSNEDFHDYLTLWKYGKLTEKEILEFEEFDEFAEDFSIYDETWREEDYELFFKVFNKEINKDDELVLIKEDIKKENELSFFEDEFTSEAYSKWRRELNMTIEEILAEVEEEFIIKNIEDELK
jgi:hypothetical protein